MQRGTHPSPWAHGDLLVLGLGVAACVGWIVHGLHESVLLWPLLAVGVQLGAGLALLLRRLQRSRADLARAVDRFEAASEASLDALFLLMAERDAQGQVQDFRVGHCNERGARLFGLSKAEMMHNTLRRCVPGRAGQHFFDQFCAVIQTRQPAKQEFFMPLGDGGIWLSHQAVPVGDGVAVTSRDITASRRREEQVVAAHQALDASERRLRAITDNVPALIAYVDRDGVYRFANARFRAWLNLDPAAVLDRTVRAVHGEAVWDEVRDDFEQAWAGTLLQVERQGRRGASTVHYRADYIPDRTDDGRVRGCYVVIIDITARREAELQMQRSQRQLSELIDNVPAMIGSFDLQQRCEYANGLSQQMLSLQPGAVPGITLVQALGEAHFAQHAPHLPAVLAGRPARYEGLLQQPGGELHYQTHLVPQRDDAGAPRGFYLIAFDITALKRAQQRQARVEQRLREVTDNLPVLISYIDDEERYQFANATYQSWLGIDPATMIGRTVHDVLGLDRYERRRSAMQRALQGQRVSFDVPTDARGGTRHLQVQFVPDRQPDGRVAGFYALSIDITALKAVERELGYLARFDALTGLANRFQFNEKLPEALARCQRTHRPLALMYLDIDHFKHINDRLGHAVGDAALKEFARRLRGCVRVTDTVARLAGDEFVVILEGLHSPDEPQRVAAKMLAEIARPFELGTHRLDITTSVGIAYTETGLGAASGLLARADQALYEAKAAGRNQYELVEA